MGKASSPAQKRAAAERWAAACEQRSSPARVDQHGGGVESEEVADLQHLIAAMRRSANAQKAKHAEELRKAEGKAHDLERQLREQAERAAHAVGVADRRATDLQRECERLRRASESSSEDVARLENDTKRMKEELAYANNALAQAGSSEAASHAAADSQISKLQWMLERASAELDEREAELEHAQTRLDEADTALNNQRRDIERPLKKKLVKEARQKEELERRLKTAQQSIDEERRQAALKSAVSEKRAAKQNRVIKERGLAIVELQVRAGEAEQACESARCMLNDERRARINERREKDIMRKELSSLRSREQHLCAALSDRQERTAAVLGQLAALPREGQAVLPQNQQSWLLAKAQSLRVALDDSAEPLDAVTEVQAAENLLERVSSQESMRVRLSVDADQRATAVSRAFSLEHSRSSAQDEEAAQAEAPTSASPAPSGPDGQNDSASLDGDKGDEDDAGWVTESDSDNVIEIRSTAPQESAPNGAGVDHGSASETEFRNWTARLVAESFQEFQEDAAAQASSVPSAESSPATAAIAAFRQRVVDGTASGEAESGVSQRDHEHDATGSDTELSWAAADRRDDGHATDGSADELPFPTTRRLSSPSSPPSASLSEWRRRRSAGAARDNVTIAHEQLQDALSPAHAVDTVHASEAAGVNDADEVVGQGITVGNQTPSSGSPASPHVAASIGRQPTAIRFSSPLESREKYRTPSPAAQKQTSQHLERHLAQETAPEQGSSSMVGGLDDYRDEGEDEEDDSEGWVTDDGDSADDEMEYPQQQRWIDDSQESGDDDKPNNQDLYQDEQQQEDLENPSDGSRGREGRSIMDRWQRIQREADSAPIGTAHHSCIRKSAEAAGAAAAGSMKWTVLDGFLRRREQRSEDNHQQRENQLQAQCQQDDSSIRNHSRTTSHASPQERRGRSLLPRGHRADRASMEDVQPARHDVDVTYMVDVDSSRRVEPARHSAAVDNDDADVARSPHAVQAVPPTDAQLQLSSDAAKARQKWRARALSPTTPTTTDNGGTTPSGDSTSVPWSDAVTPVDEPDSMAPGRQTANESAVCSSLSKAIANSHPNVGDENKAGLDGASVSGSARRIRGKARLARRTTVTTADKSRQRQSARASLF